MTTTRTDLDTARDLERLTEAVSRLMREAGERLVRAEEVAAQLPGLHGQLTETQRLAGDVEVRGRGVEELARGVNAALGQTEQARQAAEAQADVARAARQRVEELMASVGGQAGLDGRLAELRQGLAAAEAALGRGAEDRAATAADLQQTRERADSARQAATEAQAALQQASSAAAAAAADRAQAATALEALGGAPGVEALRLVPQAVTAGEERLARGRQEVEERLADARRLEEGLRSLGAELERRAAAAEQARAAAESALAVIQTAVTTIGGEERLTALARAHQQAHEALASVEAEAARRGDLAQQVEGLKRQAFQLRVAAFVLLLVALGAYWF